MKYQSFVGLEIHIHLSTVTKSFCGCRTSYGEAPNSNVCPVCLGYPGVLPAANEEAFAMSFLVARALKCALSTRCYFDRKNYFYPDMTKNYQITQFHDPVGRDGRFDIAVDGEVKTVRIHDVHLEEDAGKMIHSGSKSRLDYNRAGSSLLEIVTEPDLVDGADAEAFVREFRRMVRYLGVCDGNMEEGSLRCDANVSINLPGQGLGTKTEVKNLNSARFVRKALDYEIRRQSKALDAGERIVQETRLWDGDRGVTASMRTKEKAHDYRYFPEPDMPPFSPDTAFLAGVDARLVELPLARRQRYVASYRLPEKQVAFLVEDRTVADFFEACVSRGGDPRHVANWMVGEMQAQLKRTESSLEDSHITPERLVALMTMVDEGRLNRGRAKEVLEIIILEDGDPSDIVAQRGWEQVLDESDIYRWVKDVVDGHAQAVAQVKQGNAKPLSFLMGQVMKASRGKADPRRAMEVIKETIGVQS